MLDFPDESDHMLSCLNSIPNLEKHYIARNFLSEYSQAKDLQNQKSEDLIDDEVPDEKSEDFSKNTFNKLSLTELKNLLKKAVDDENYEVAAKIRDEISKR